MAAQLAIHGDLLLAKVIALMFDWVPAFAVAISHPNHLMQSSFVRWLLARRIKSSLELQMKLMASQIEAKSINFFK